LDRRVPLGDPAESQDFGRRVPEVAPPITDPSVLAEAEGAQVRPDQNRIDEEEPNPLVGPEREARRAPAA